MVGCPYAERRREWRADHGARAIKRIVDIEVSIAALANEDLLDLADIFLNQPHAPLSQMTAAEMAKRHLGL